MTGDAMTPSDGLEASDHDSPGARGRWVWVLLWVAVAAHFAGFYGHSLYRYSHYTCFEDLDHFEHWLWSTLNGELFYNFDHETSQFGVHCSPVLFLLLPVYACWQSPRLVLLVHVLFLSLAAVPLFMLARLALRDARAGLLIALAYLCYPPLNKMIMSPVAGTHEISLVPPFIVLMIYAAEARKPWLLLVSALLVLSVKENMPPVVAGLGVWLLLRRRYKIGAACIVGGVLWFAFAMFVVMPLGQGRNAFEMAALRVEFPPELGKSLPQVLVSCVTKPVTSLGVIFGPSRTRFMKEMLGPLGFLPVLSPEAWLPAAASWAQALLSSEDKFRCAYRWRHTALIPLVFVAATYAMLRVTLMLEWLRARKQVRLPAASSLAVALAAALFGLAWASHLWIDNWMPPSDAKEHAYIMTSERARQVDEALEVVPAKAKVIASHNLLNRFARRHGIGWLRQCHKDVWDYAVVDTRLSIPRHLPGHLKTQGYVEVARGGGVIVFRHPRPSVAVTDARAAPR